MRVSVLIAALLVPSFAVGYATVLRNAEHPHVAWATPNADYPLKVHFLSSDRNHSVHHGIDDTTSYGSGNILGSPNVGFDYNSNCSGGFLHNAEAEDFYQGKWKQPNRKLEILTVETGSTHFEKCTVNVTIKPAPYTRDNPPPHLVTAH